MNRTMTALGTSISRRQVVGGMLAAAVAGYGSGYYDYYGTMW